MLSLSKHGVTVGMTPRSAGSYASAAVMLSLSKHGVTVGMTPRSAGSYASAAVMLRRGRGTSSV